MFKRKLTTILLKKSKNLKKCKRLKKTFLKYPTLFQTRWKE